MTDAPVRIDLGCGNAKKPGFIGLDYVEMDQVDHVLDLTADKYPFDDDSVDEIFSAHFLEHIEEPNHVFGEIGRIAKDGAKIEFWTPYAFSNGAFLYGHLHFLTEEPWEHFCISHRDAYIEMLGGRWLLKHIQFVVKPEVEEDLRNHGVPIGFAIRYLKGVVYEFGVTIEFRRDPAVGPTQPSRSWAKERDGFQHPLDDIAESPFVRADTIPAPADPLSKVARRIPESIKRPLRKIVK